METAISYDSTEYIKPVGRQSAMGLRFFYTFCWQCQESKALATLYLVHFSELCLQQGSNHKQ